jgi:hypothetical protein
METCPFSASPVSRAHSRVPATFAWRYAEETVALLAARAPKLRRAVRDANKAGYPYVVVDGTLVEIDRVAADRPFYSGKHRKHGMNLQVIASPCGGDPVGVRGTVNGADQRFQIVTIKGSDNSTTGYLEAISPSGQVFYVTPTSGAKNAQLKLTTSRPTADDMAKSGPYTFPNTGLVADDAGQSKVNGAKVISYQQDNGTNQQWSMP